MSSRTAATGVSPRSGSVVVGRERERRVLRRLVESIPTGGRSLAVVGEAGSGKSTLLELTAAGAAGVRTIRLSGVESEAGLSFAAAADLLLPLAGQFDKLVPAQRDALKVACAVRPGALPGLLAVCAAALGVLAAESAREPLLVLVDNWQWIDPPSQQMLLFVARRLAADRVGLVLALRTQCAEAVGPPGMPVVELTGLTVAEALTLADALGIDVSDDVLEQLVELTAGNPLALTDTLTSTPSAALAGLSTALRGLVIGPTLRRAWGTLLDDLPPAAATALFAAAASHAGAVDELEAALAGLGGELVDLAAAERRGLIRLSTGTVELHHPLLWQVLVDRTPGSEQRRIHQALAATALGHRRAWFAAAAASPPDDGVADALDAAAADARDRGDHRAAAQAWTRAADFTTDGPRRGDRLLAAATSALRAGRGRMAAALAGDALAARSDDPRFTADTELVRARAHLVSGRPRRARNDLVRAAAAAEVVDPSRSRLLYAEATWPCAMSGDVHGMLDIVDRCLVVAADGADLPVAATSAAALALGGRTREARMALDRAEEMLAGRTWGQEDLRFGTFAGQAATCLEEYGRASALLRAAVDGARRSASPAALASALSASANLSWWTGAWNGGRTEADEALRWAEEYGQVGLTALVSLELARLDAVRGDSAAARVRVERAARAVDPFDFGCMDVLLPAVSGLDALGAGRFEEAAELLDRAVDAGCEQGLSCSTAAPVLGDLIEARVRIGDRAGAQEAVVRAELEARVTGLAHPAAVAARGRGLLAADVDEARDAFDRARAVHDRSRVPFERARTLLCEGETLRRLRHPAAARRPLQEAVAVFDRLDARPWSERARGELAATGPPRSRRGPSGVGLAGLTPQELHVARGVAEGLSNPEIAAVVFLSRKTVEAHLSRTYRKLGIRSRSELARLFGEQHVERAGS